MKFMVELPVCKLILKHIIKLLHIRIMCLYQVILRPIREMQLIVLQEEISPFKLKQEIILLMGLLAALRLTPLSV